MFTTKPYLSNVTVALTATPATSNPMASPLWKASCIGSHSPFRAPSLMISRIIPSFFSDKSIPNITKAPVGLHIYIPAMSLRISMNFLGRAGKAPLKSR